MHGSLGNNPRWRWMIVSMLALMMVTAVAGVASGQAQTNGCTNLIADSGFESGAGWNQQSQVGYDLISDYRVLSGQRAAHLAGFNGADDQISTTVTVPAEATTLSFWWYVETDENGAGTDQLSVQIADSSGAPLSTLLTASDEQAATFWRNATFNLNPFAGQTIQIRFLAQNDDSLETDFFIDDVVAASCSGGDAEFRVFLPFTER